MSQRVRFAQPQQHYCHLFIIQVLIKTIESSMRFEKIVFKNLQSFRGQINFSKPLQRELFYFYERNGTQYYF